MDMLKHRRSLTASVAVVAAATFLAGGALSTAIAGGHDGAHPGAPNGGAKAAKKQKKPDYPPFADVVDGYMKIVSAADGRKSLYTLYKKKDEAQVLAVLPPNFESQDLFIGSTIAAGDIYSGIQWSDLYVKWKRYGKRLALVEPNVSVRSTGDAESKQSLETVFTDRVLLDIPIVTMSPAGGPVIDMDDLMLGKATVFFGPSMKGLNKKISSIAKAKAFPHNVELAFEAPAADGTLKTLHYSVSLIPHNPSYKPRKADPRLGYFTTTYRDVGSPDAQKPYTRYINRWHLEKADPSLKLSPPKEPIVFYIEHTTPIRYRRWVREGLEAWNRAFEQCGIVNAIQVYQQDASTGAHMEKDPEDVRFNFIRWTTAETGFAIGPSRANPKTGQILDADVVIPAQFVRGWARTYRQLLPEAAMEGFSPETLAWLDRHPSWDPRVRLAPPAERTRILEDRAAARASNVAREAAGHPAANADPHLMGNDQFDGLAGRVSQVNGACAAGLCKAIDMALFRMSNDVLVDLIGNESDDDSDMLDGLPDWFVGPLLKDLIMHEVGHTIGLRHNFKASTIHDLSQINSEAMIGKPNVGSVMDYNPVNINMEDGPVQGPFTMTDIGHYDMWVIHYGYSLEKDLSPILARVSEPELIYGTDEDTWGPDPRARRGDVGANPLDFADSRMRLAQHLRARITERMVKEGDSWAKATDSFNLLLAIQMGAISTAANWVGGSYINRDMKGDPGDRDPVSDIPAEQQRRALKFVITNAFFDDAFGIDRELLRKMSVDKWWDDGGYYDIFTDATWETHDKVLGVQAAAMTMLMNPTTLRRVYDNEYRVSATEDALTLPEMMSTVTESVWAELGAPVDKHFTSRKPMISSMRRNLQREHLDRMIDLTMPEALSGAAAKPISNLATMHLRDVQQRIDARLEKANSKIDPYTVAHLQDATLRIGRALDAQYIFNANAISGGSTYNVYMESAPD